MAYIKIPVLGILGFVFGSCITIIITLIFIPASEFWPSSYEDRVVYTREIMLNYNFSFLPTLLRLNKTATTNKTFVIEEEYLRQRASILCYSIEEEMDDLKHARLILDTWSAHCDHMIMFYTNYRFMETLHPKYKPPHKSTVELVYLSSHNSTIKSLFSVLQKHLQTYQWFTYVPPKVFLIPNNLRYFLVSSKLNSKEITFSGKPDISRLTGTWAVSMKSPLTMSNGAITKAMNKNDASCLNDYIQDPGCIIEITGGKILDMRDAEGTRVINEMPYGGVFVQYTNIQVKERLKSRFPVSVYVKGSYKNLIDLEYYLHHIKAYGSYPIQGSYSRPN